MSVLAYAICFFFVFCCAIYVCVCDRVRLRIGFTPTQQNLYKASIVFVLSAYKTQTFYVRLKTFNSRYQPLYLQFSHAVLPLYTHHQYRGSWCSLLKAYLFYIQYRSTHEQDRLHMMTSQLVFVRVRHSLTIYLYYYYYYKLLYPFINITISIHCGCSYIHSLL